MMRKINTPPKSDDPFDNIVEADEQQPEERGEVVGGILVVGEPMTGEELEEWQRKQINPETLEEKIEVYVYGRLFEVDGVIEQTPNLLEGLALAGITFEELFQLCPHLAPEKSRTNQWE